MTLPSDDLARDALEATAIRTGTLWYWDKPNADEPPLLHGEEEALRIAKACLWLGVPVTDVVTGLAWMRMIERIDVLEDALEAIR
jgi:hypothetical protein